MGIIDGQGGHSWIAADTATATDVATRDDIANPYLKQGTEGRLVWSDAPSAEWLAEPTSETALINNVADRLLRDAPEGVTPPLCTEAVTMFRGLLPYTGSMSYKTLGQLADIAYGTTNFREAVREKRGAA